MAKILSCEICRLLCIMILIFSGIAGCEIFDPDSDDSDEEPFPTNTPLPTASPEPTATPFQARSGHWTGTALTWSFNATEPGTMAITVMPDLFSGTAVIWINDTYTADGGGPFWIDVAYNGTSDGVSIEAAAHSMRNREKFYSFFLEGRFDDAEHASGIWSCRGAVPTDADWDDWGTWTAAYLHD